jgi:hypothetical protein
MNISEEKSIVGLLLIIVLMISINACMDGGPKSATVFFYKQPAIVLNVQNVNSGSVKREYDFQTLRNLYLYRDTSMVPFFDLKNGDYMLADFSTTTDDFTNYGEGSPIVIQNFECKMVEHNEIKMMLGEMKSEDTDSLSAVQLMLSPVKNTLFFSFAKKAPRDQIYGFELICNEDSIDYSRNDTTIYMLYARAKIIDQGSDTLINTTNLHAFEIDPLIRKYFSDAYSIYFKIKYKYGVDEFNNDIYKDTGSSTSSYIWKADSLIYSVRISK